jgi:hypothetical protein
MASGRATSSCLRLPPSTPLTWRLPAPVYRPRLGQGHHQSHNCYNHPRVKPLHSSGPSLRVSLKGNMLPSLRLPGGFICTSRGRLELSEGTARVTAVGSIFAWCHLKAQGHRLPLAVESELRQGHVIVMMPAFPLPVALGVSHHHRRQFCSQLTTPSLWPSRSVALQVLANYVPVLQVGVVDRTSSTRLFVVRLPVGVTAAQLPVSPLSLLPGLTGDVQASMRTPRALTPPSLRSLLTSTPSRSRSAAGLQLFEVDAPATGSSHSARHSGSVSPGAPRPDKPWSRGSSPVWKQVSETLDEQR